MVKKKNGVIQIYCDKAETKIYYKYFIFNGKREGELKSYFIDGQLDIILNYINDKAEGEYKSYHENGQLYTICNYKNDKAEGEYKEYYNNKQLWKNYGIIKMIT